MKLISKLFRVQKHIIPIQVTLVVILLHTGCDFHFTKHRMIIVVLNLTFNINLS